jgi:hypothetical protein
VSVLSYLGPLFAFSTPIAGVQCNLAPCGCNELAVYLVFLVGNLADFPFLFTSIGVSGFEGREVISEVIWLCNI